MTRPRPRSGVSLTELLVLLAFAVVLIGLLIVGVQKVRATAGRVQCSNNLHRLGVATHLYHDLHDEFPAGSLGAPPGSNPHTDPAFLRRQHVGLLASLLPHLDRDDVFRQLDVAWQADAAGPAWWTAAPNWTVAQYRIKVFLCPADDPDRATRGTIVLHATYAADDGRGTMTAFHFGNPTGAALGKTNYVGVMGGLGRVGNGWDKWEGIFLPQVRHTREEIAAADGLSQTLLLGETHGGNRRTPTSALPGDENFALAWMGAGSLPVAWGLPEPCEWYTFGSSHPGAVNFCFADGSVRGLRKGLDGRGPLRHAAGWHDGVAYSASDLSQ